jgi:hypothetical protein
MFTDRDSFENEQEYFNNIAKAIIALALIQGCYCRAIFLMFSFLKI